MEGGYTMNMQQQGKQSRMQIVRPRLKKAPNPYRFYHAYQVKAAFAMVSAIASLVSGRSQVDRIRCARFGNKSAKKLLLANAVVGVTKSMVDTYQAFLGNNPYSFREVYGQKMRKKNAN